MAERFFAIVLIATVAAAPGLKAEPYSTVLGDKTVTSVSRSPTKGVGVSREELLKAARDSQPITVVPSELASRHKIK